MGQIRPSSLLTPTEQHNHQHDDRVNRVTQKEGNQYGHQKDDDKRVEK